jgi:hypothetical protein
MTLYDFDIIGFASTIETPALPRVLAPVFRDRTQPDVVVLPPFTVLGDEVFNVIRTNTAELQALVAQEKLTIVDSPIPAKTNHDLWVNPEGFVAYASKAEVKKAFKALFTKHLALAEVALAANDHEAACRNAAIARAVNPGHLDPLVIRATAERQSGDMNRFAFTQHMAQDIVASGEFDRLIEARMGGVTAAESRGSNVMRDMGLRRSRYTTLQAA